MNEWIRVNFAVPPDDREVLVIFLYKDTNTSGKEYAYYTVHIASRLVFQNGHIKWRQRNGGYLTDHRSKNGSVIYWKPIPVMPHGCKDIPSF